MPRFHREKGDGQQHRGRSGHHFHPTTFQQHMIAASGEFVGTFFFLYFAYGAQVMLAEQTGEVALANGGKSAQTNIFTALIYGFSLLVNVWAFYRISGGLLNPAVRCPAYIPQD